MTEIFVKFGVQALAKIESGETSDTIVTPTGLRFHQQPVAQSEGNEFKVQPIIQIVDAQVL